MKSLKLKNYAFYSLVLLILSDAVEYLASPGRLNLNSTYVTGALKLISVVYLFKYISKTNWKLKIPKIAYNIFMLMVVWNIITAFRGAIAAKDYWDWKFLFLRNSFAFIIPYAMIFGIVFIHNIKMYRFIINKLFSYGFYLLPLAVISLGTFYTTLMFPVCLFILFSVYFKRKYLFLVLAVAFFSVITGLEIRSNVLRVIVPCLLLLVYYFRFFFTKGWIKILCYPLFFIPLILFYLGVSGIFNIFKPFEGDKVKVVSADNAAGGDLEQDTRTGLYQEVLLSMGKKNSFLLGEGATAKYESATFDNLNDGRGRYGAEVGFLNTLLYSGIVGVIFYLMILLTACNYAINHSNNYLCKLLAIFLAFRWALFFIEDVSNYDVNFYFLWIAIGLCLSKEFRSLTDLQLKTFFTQMTNSKPLKVQQYLKY